MKFIKYDVLCKRVYVDRETRQEEQKEMFVTVQIPYNDENLEKAKEAAHNGVYTIEDDGTEEVAAPTKLDAIEAQVTYTAMMTDTMLEV